MNQVENPDQIVDHAPDQCQDCSATLSKSDTVGFSARQVFDIPKPPPLFVTEHRAHTCQCSECGAKVRAAFPGGVNAPVQYGNEIASLVAYLQTTQCLPDHRTAMLLSEWWDIKLSSGTVANLTARKAQEFRGAHTHLYDILSGRLVAVKHLDETGIRVAGRLEWLHILCSRFLSHLRLGEKRGDIPRDLEGTVIHDCLSSYFTMENVRHGVCNQHLIRELTAAHEIDGEPWAAEMEAILYDGRDLAEAARSAGQDAVDPVAIAEVVGRYDDCWRKAIKYHEGLPPLPRLSNKGPKKKRKAHNLALRFQHYKDMVLLFLHDLSVPFTNNEAEQGLRMPKVQEKGKGLGVLQNQKRCGELPYPQVRHRNWTKTRMGNFGYFKGRACSIHQASKDCLIAPTSGLDLPYLNAPGKKLPNDPWERHWAVVNLLPKSAQR